MALSFYRLEIQRDGHWQPDQMWECRPCDLSALIETKTADHAPLNIRITRHKGLPPADFCTFAVLRARDQ